MLFPQPFPSVQVVAGTVATPGYSFAGDSNTGVYSPGADALAVATGGTERLRIDAGGNVGIGTTSPTTKLYVSGGSSVHGLYAETANPTAIALWAGATSASYTFPVCLLDAARAASSSFIFLQARSGGGADTKFKLVGDGNAFADGAWTGGGADYAEFFQWADGNPDREDRRGLAVVLTTGGAVRPATATDPTATIIGVVSANPTVIGDAAWSHWAGKYRRDDYGGLIGEDYELVSWDDAEGQGHSYAADAVPEGVIVPPDARRQTQSRPALSPAFDPATGYVPRSERPEWVMIGLMGKLRLRAGQPVGERWLKLRTISDAIDEWLVR